jgi:hypothetical protein
MKQICGMSYSKFSLVCYCLVIGKLVLQLSIQITLQLTLDVVMWNVEEVCFIQRSVIKDTCNRGNNLLHYGTYLHHLHCKFNSWNVTSPVSCGSQQCLTWIFLITIISSFANAFCPSTFTYYIVESKSVHFTNSVVAILYLCSMFLTSAVDYNGCSVQY